MDVREVECFLAVAEHLHFGKAAHVVHLTQPTVSEAIRRLELEIGGKLFERTTRSVRLTPLGAAVLPELRRAYDAWVTAFAHARAAAVRGAQPLEVGFTADSRDAFMPIIVALRERAPRTVPHFTEVFSLEQLEALGAGTLDVGVCWTSHVGGSLESEPLSRSGFVALVAPEDPLATREGLLPRHLAGRTVIALPHTLNPALIETVTAAFKRSGAPFVLSDDEVSYENMAARVLGGEGVGIAPATAALALRLDTIVYVPLIDEELVADRQLVWRRSLPTDVIAALRTAAKSIRGRHASEPSSRSGHSHRSSRSIGKNAD